MLSMCYRSTSVRESRSQDLNPTLSPEYQTKSLELASEPCSISMKSKLNNPNKNLRVYIQPNDPSITSSTY